jgi:hypothetical protein
MQGVTHTRRNGCRDITARVRPLREMSDSNKPRSKLCLLPCYPVHLHINLGTKEPPLTRKSEHGVPNPPCALFRSVDRFLLVTLTGCLLRG